MKINKVLLLLVIIFISSVISKKVRKNKLKSKDTPKGYGLRNHYGTLKLNSPYGPQTDSLGEYVQANPDTFAPFKGHVSREKILAANNFEGNPQSNERLFPGPVKAGKYTNISPSAKNEIKPEITAPKIEVNGEYNVPMNLKVPQFQGFAKEQHPVVAYDKFTGEIIEDTVLIKRPVYNYDNRVANVARNFRQHYDLRTGEKITKLPHIKKHGVNTVNTDDWKAPEKHKHCKTEDASSDDNASQQQ